MAAKAKCVGALLVRNEAGSDRYLQRALGNAALFCDELVVLDDGSTDDTRSVCQRHPAVSIVESQQVVDGGWWQGGAEASARQHLWELARLRAGDNGWVYVFDADHELLGLRPEEFRVLLESEVVDSWACPLWDCWDGERLQRVDSYWQAWARPRVWLARALQGAWGARGIHCGHLPLRNWTAGIMPAGAGIRHLGYLRKEARQAKMQRYLNLGVAG